MLRQHTCVRSVPCPDDPSKCMLLIVWKFSLMLLMHCAGEMRDTVEVLWEIFKAVRAVRGGTELVEACFGQRVIEHVLCGPCGQKATHVSECTELIFTASATALQRHVRVSRAFTQECALAMAS